MHARPGASGAIDGLSDVGRYNNFCEPSKLNGYYSCTFGRDQAFAHQQMLHDDFSVLAGPSTGASLWLANEVHKQSPKSQVAFIAADGKIGPDAVLDLEPLGEGKVARLLADLD